MYVSKPKKVDLEAKKMITLNIPHEIYIEIKKRHLSYPSIFLRGYQALTGEPQIFDRTRELEQSVEKLNKVIDKYRERLYKLESEAIEK